MYLQDIAGPVGPACKHPLTAFGGGDDEKRACLHPDDLSKMGKQKSSEQNPDCTVYSIGSNNQWDFEMSIYNKTSCRIETFDCTCDGNVPNKIKDRTRFHKICLGDRNKTVNGKQHLSWSEMNSVVGVKSAPSYLKIDIEGKIN
jgi:hypothetical protein